LSLKCCVHVKEHTDVTKCMLVRISFRKKLAAQSIRCMNRESNFVFTNLLMQTNQLHCLLRLTGIYVRAKSDFHLNLKSSLWDSMNTMAVRYHLSPSTSHGRMRKLTTATFNLSRIKLMVSTMEFMWAPSFPYTCCICNKVYSVFYDSGFQPNES